MCINSAKENCFSQKYQKWICLILEINSSIIPRLEVHRLCHRVVYFHERLICVHEFPKLICSHRSSLIPCFCLLSASGLRKKPARWLAVGDRCMDFHLVFFPVQCIDSCNEVILYTERQKKHHLFRATLTKIHRIKINHIWSLLDTD